jgi:tRNA G46 methylase TrmB
MSKLIEKLLSLDGHVCPWWLAWTFDNPLRKWFQDPERIFGSLVREGMIVADIGCGMGYFSVAMGRMVGPAGRVLSVDLQEKMLQYLAKRAVRAGVQDRITTTLGEPDDIKIMHVSQRRFEEILGYAKSAGLVVSDGPKVGMSRSAVLERR